MIGVTLHSQFHCARQPYLEVLFLAGEPQTSDPTPQTSNLEPETLNPNPKPKNKNAKPKIMDPNSQAQKHKPSTLDPKALLVASAVTNHRYCNS